MTAYILSFLIGCAVGSFLNVVIDRVNPEHEDSAWSLVQGRSHCDKCKKTLQWFELIPIVSFFMQAGKCRSCGARLSRHYPVVEFITGAAFTLIWWRVTELLPFHMPNLAMIPQIWVLGFILCWWVIVGLGILISAYDIKYYLIPNTLLVALIVSACITQAYAFIARAIFSGFLDAGLMFTGNLVYMFGMERMAFMRIIWGLVCGLALIGGAFVFSRGKGMGFGDVLIAAAFGVLFGWPDIMVVLFVAFVSGTLVSIGLLAMRKKDMKSMVPFGPFLIFGALTTMLVGDILIAGYVRVFPILLTYSI